MIRKQASLMLAALLVTMIGVAVYAQSNTLPTQTNTSQPGMMSQSQWTGMMKQMGMTDGMVMRCRMMSAAQISAYDPASVLAYQTGLNLSDDQVKQIQAIVDKAREQVKAVLTPDQVANLQPMAAGPQSMTQMCQHMQQMRRQRGGQWDSGIMMMCPMMWTPPTQPAADNAPQQQRQRERNPWSCCPMN